MNTAKRWTVEILLDEHGDQHRTRAEARLHTNDNTHLIATGIARRRPGDAEVPEIGDEIAAARALLALGHQLLLAAAGDLDQLTHEPARLHW